MRVCVSVCVRECVCVCVRECVCVCMCVSQHTLMVGCLITGWTVRPDVSTARPSSSNIRGIGLETPVSLPVSSRPGVCVHMYTMSMYMHVYMDV